MNEFSMGTANFYRHSGKAPILGLILMGVAGFVVTPILGLIYGYLLRYIPLIYINFFIVLGYAYAVSFVISKMARIGKVRNMFLLGLAGLFFGLLAEYIGWVSWIAAMVGDPSYLLAFLHPLDILHIIKEIAKEGAWSLNGATPTGWQLYLIWFIEACMVIGGITYLTITSLFKIPFCEESDTWTESKGVIAAFGTISDESSFKESIKQGNFSKFNELKPALTQNQFTILELYECPVCKNFHVLNVKKLTTARDRKGKQNNKEHTIISNLIINQSTLGSIKRLFESHQAETDKPSVG